MKIARLVPAWFVSVCLLACCAALSGCGPDVVTAAAGSAASSAAAAKQAQEQKAHVEAQLKALQETEQKRLQNMTEQADDQSK